MRPKVGDVLFIPYGTIHGVKDVGSGKNCGTRHSSFYGLAPPFYRYTHM